MDYTPPRHILFLEKRIRYLRDCVLEREVDFDIDLMGRQINYYLIPRGEVVFDVLPYPYFVRALRHLPHELPTLSRELKYLQDGTQISLDPEAAAYDVAEWCDEQRANEVSYLREEWFCCAFEQRMADLVECCALRFDALMIDRINSRPTDRQK